MTNEELQIALDAANKLLRWIENEMYNEDFDAQEVIDRIKKHLEAQK